MTLPGTVYWIDHYTVGTNNLDRWIDFHERVLGAQTQPASDARRERGVFQSLTNSRLGGFVQRAALPAAAGPGEALPRYALFVRPDELDEHLRRLDSLEVPHSVRTSGSGAIGTAIYFVDPDGNQFEFWAPEQMPDGAMNDCGPLKVGRISHVTYGSRDLGRTAQFFRRYCELEPLPSPASDDATLILPLAAGARLVFEHVDDVPTRTSGRGVYRDLHTALVVREEAFWPNYERLWAGLPEWQFVFGKDAPPADAVDLAPRSVRHSSPAGSAWHDAFGRGDDWFDWDGNLFHFYVGIPRGDSMAAYEPRPIEDYMQAYLEARGIPFRLPEYV